MRKKTALEAARLLCDTRRDGKRERESLARRGKLGARSDIEQAPAQWGRLERVRLEPHFPDRAVLVELDSKRDLGRPRDLSDMLFEASLDVSLS